MSPTTHNTLMMRKYTFSQKPAENLYCQSVQLHIAAFTLGLGELKLARALHLLIVLCCFYCLISHLLNNIKHLCKSWSERKALERGNPVPVSGGTMATSKRCFSTTTGGSMVFSQYCFLSQETKNTMHS